MTQNQIAYHNAVETKRHNMMTEAEVSRHQMRQEQLQAEANELQRQANAINELHYARMDAETQRSNRAREIENYRSDIASEDIKSRANAISAAMASETSRHQKSMESIQQSLNSSIISKNMAEVSYTSANTGYIQARTGTEMFNQRKIQEDIKLSPVQRNLLSEQAKTQQSVRWINVTNGVNNAFSAAGNLIRSIVPIVM